MINALVLLATLATQPAPQTTATTPAVAGTPSLTTPAPGKAMSNPVVTIKTNLGSFDVELFADKAPKSVENFLGYVKANHYDNTIFHRVIAGFMVQGGGFDPQMSKKATRAPVVNEAGNGLKNTTGTIAMARTADPDSATCQFYVNVKDNASLDRSAGSPGYTVFGKVVGAGMDVVRKIEASKTSTQNGM